MSLEIIRDDITKVDCDAIVNSANPEPVIGGGVDHAIYEAADAEKMLAARQKIGALEAGEAEATPAFGLPQKYVIHAVGPVWQDGSHSEAELLAATYKRCLELTKELGCESVSFPVISAGIFGFPKADAVRIAVDTISGFLFDNEITVYLVVYNRKIFELSGKVYEGIKSYIEESDVLIPPKGRSIESRGPLLYGDLDEALPENHSDLGSPFEGSFKGTIRPEAEEESISMPLSEDELGEMIEKHEETFQEHLFRIIDRRGLDDKDVYKRANIDRRHFSKIKSNAEYSPSKRTAVAFAVALELNLDETKDLLRRAGIALSRSSVFDIIICYCIEHKVYDVNEINMILFKYDQPTLGA